MTRLMVGLRASCMSCVSLPTARRAKWVAWVLFGCAALAQTGKAAENTTHISDDFLEYLGNMERNDGDWTEFADQEISDSSAKTPAADASTPAAKVNVKPATPTPARQAESSSAASKVSK